MRKAHQRTYHCINGPLHGTKLSLATPVTMPFTIKGESGRYRPALFVLRCYDVGGYPYTATVTDRHKHNHKAVSTEIKYQQEPAGKLIHWEPL